MNIIKTVALLIATTNIFRTTTKSCEAFINPVIPRSRAAHIITEELYHRAKKPRNTLLYANNLPAKILPTCILLEDEKVEITNSNGVHILEDLEIEALYLLIGLTKSFFMEDENPEIENNPEIGNYPRLAEIADDFDTFNVKVSLINSGMYDAVLDPKSFMPLQQEDKIPYSFSEEEEKVWQAHDGNINLWMSAIFGDITLYGSPVWIRKVEEILEPYQNLSLIHI